MKVRDYQRENKLRKERKAQKKIIFGTGVKDEREKPKYVQPELRRHQGFQEDKENWEAYPMRPII